MGESLKKAIERTREYGRSFGVEYDDHTVKERLISKKIFSLKVKSQKSESLIVKKKMDLAIKLAKDIEGKFGDILFIGVTGSVAAGYPPPECDIDFMIITKKDSLWITRLWLRIYVWLKRIPHRKYGAEEKKDEFCFNLWLEEDVLELPKNKQILKNAMDLILMKPILNRNRIYEKFVLENSWAKKWVATGYSRLITNDKLLITNDRNNLIKKILNWMVFWPQWWYMRNKIGKGLVDLKRAFFHPK